MTAIAALAEATRTAGATFSWKVAPAGGVTADAAGAELTSIVERDGIVTSTAVVEAARPADAPLHPAFEWDDAVAAEAYREGQAEHLIRSLVVVYQKPDGEPAKPTRYLVNIRGRADEATEDAVVATAATVGAYVPIQRVMENDELRRRYVKQAHQELTAWRRRYQDIRELASIFDVIDALQEG